MGEREKERGRKREQIAKGSPRCCVLTGVRMHRPAPELARTDQRDGGMDEWMVGCMEGGKEGGRDEGREGGREGGREAAVRRTCNEESECRI